MIWFWFVFVLHFYYSSDIVFCYRSGKPKCGLTHVRRPRPWLRLVVDETKRLEGSVRLFSVETKRISIPCFSRIPHFSKGPGAAWRFRIRLIGISGRLKMMYFRDDKITRILGTVFGKSKYPEVKTAFRMTPELLFKIKEEQCSMIMPHFGDPNRWWAPPLGSSRRPSPGEELEKREKRK